MRYILILGFLIISRFCFSTEQNEDIIIYNGDTCYLETSWEYPSILQVYFQKNRNLKYPFEMISTANYRGHIATWLIENNELYLIRIESKKKEIELKKIFKDKVINGRVRADWFSGFLRINKSFYKKAIDSPDDDYVGYYTTGYKSYILVKIQNGATISTNEFDEAIFWSSMNKIRHYDRVNHKDSLLFQEYIRYLMPNYDKQKPEKIFSESDFKLFINRFIVKPDTMIKVPLTYYGIVKNATYDKAEIENMFLNSKLLINDSSSLLIFQLNNYWLPYGPWDEYSSGSVEIIIKLPKNIPQAMDLNNLKTSDYHMINRFVAYKAQKFLKGNINFSNISDSVIYLNGTVSIESLNPTTRQEIILDNVKIPVQTIKEYIARNDPDAKADEEYEEIEKRTKEYYNRK